MMKVELPNRCFVSHSYRDEDAIQSLEKSVPPNVKLVKFKWKKPDVSNAVSDNIIPKILRCDGLVYLEGGHSAKSAWVRFERDYGLRTEKPVFAFDPKTKEFFRDRGKPLDLRVQVFVSEKSMKRARKLLKWMRRNRQFDIGEVAPVHHMGDIQQLLEDIANDQKLVVWLVDDDTEGYFGFERELEDGDVELDVPDGWWPPPRIFARIDPQWEPWTDPDPEVYAVGAGEGYVLPDMIDLVEGAGADGLNWNRVDDLIVQITLCLADLPPIVDND